MCDFCEYTITCRVCGIEHRQLGSTDNTQPCGQCMSWARKTILKLLKWPRKFSVPGQLTYYSLMEIEIRK